MALAETTFAKHSYVVVVADASTYDYEGYWHELIEFAEGRAWYGYSVEAEARSLVDDYVRVYGDPDSEDYDDEIAGDILGLFVYHTPSMKVIYSRFVDGTGTYNMPNENQALGRFNIDKLFPANEFPKGKPKPRTKAPVSKIAPRKQRQQEKAVPVVPHKTAKKTVAKKAASGSAPVPKARAQRTSNGNGGALQGIVPKKLLRK